MLNGDWTSDDDTEARTLTSVDDRSLCGAGVTEMNDSCGTRWCVDPDANDGGTLDGALGTGGSAGGVAVVTVVLVLVVVLLDGGGNLSSNDSNDGIGSDKFAEVLELDLADPVPFLLSSS